MIKAKGFYLKNESVRIRLLDGKISDEEMHRFSWAKIGKNKYAVILPQVFRSEPGAKLCIVTAKKFGELMGNLTMEAQ